MPWNRETARAYRELGPQDHVEILREVVPDLLGDLGGRRALDFGCGPGRLAVALAEAGAAEVVAVDESSEMVDRARDVASRQAAEVRRRVTIRRGDESLVSELGQFDAVLSSLALMMCGSRQRLRAVSQALVAALRRGGRLLVVITHPCFRRSGYDTFRYRLPDDYDYWQSGTPYEVVLTPDSADRQAVITDYHWTLEDYCSALTGAGAAVIHLSELPASWAEDGEPCGAPAYLVLGIERHPGTGGWT